MVLPNGASAVVELAKLVHYCLDATHPRGRHKARVFASRLGITEKDAPTLRAAILRAAATLDGGVVGVRDGFGQRFTLDFEVSGPEGTAAIRTAWIIRTSEDFPRFISCYVL